MKCISTIRQRVALEDYFDYFSKALIVLSATSDGVSIVSFATAFPESVEIASASFSFTFSITTRIAKILLKTTQHKKENHNKIVMLARNKLSSIQIIISKALIINKISHEHFTTIINEEITIVN